MFCFRGYWNHLFRVAQERKVKLNNKLIKENKAMRQQIELHEQSQAMLVRRTKKFQSVRACVYACARLRKYLCAITRTLIFVTRKSRT